MGLPPLSQDELARTLEVLRRHAGNVGRAARELGIGRMTLHHRLGRMGMTPAQVRAERASVADVPSQGTTVPIPEASGEPDGPLGGREETRRRDSEAKLRRALREAHRDDLDADRIRDFAFRLGSSSVDPPGWLLEDRSSSSGPGVPMTFWSDWHWGEHVSSEELGGVNAYGVEEARRRVRALVERTLDLTLRHMVAPSYPGIVVGLGGDMLSGDIHEELVDSNEQTIIESALELSGVLVWALTEIAKHFPRVVVPCVTGNHDRLSKRPRFAGRVATSMAWLIYCTAERALRDRGVSNVQLMIPRTFDCALNVYGHRYLFTHGDSLGVKGGDGIIGAIGPIKRGVLRILAQREAIGQSADTVVMGHWHTYLTLPGIIVNGSLKGYDAYAYGNRFRPEPPCQALWYSHPRHGITSHWPVYVHDGGATREPMEAFG